MRFDAAAPFDAEQLYVFQFRLITRRAFEEAADPQQIARIVDYAGERIRAY